MSNGLQTEHLLLRTLDQRPEGTASECLTRSIRVSGVVAHGEHRGRTIGFPTANLYLDDESNLPLDGVYGGFVRDLDQDTDLLGASAISIGTNPTFGRHRRRLEAHILEFDADIYGHAIEAELTFWIRSMATFNSVDELVATIAADVTEVARLTHGLDVFIGGFTA